VPPLFNLVDKSLLCVDGRTDPPLYHLLDSTRAYAMEKLAAAGELQQCSEAHAAHLYGLLMERKSTACPREREDWQSLCRRIIDDIRGALDWGLGEHGNAVLACKLTAASAPVWHEFALMAEYRERSTRALRAIAQTHLQLPDIELQLHLALGHADFNSAGLASGTDCAAFFAFNTALEQAELSGALRQKLDALYGIVVLMVKAGNYAEGLRFVERIQDLAGRTEEADALYHRLHALVDAHRGEHRSALHHLDAATRLYAPRSVERGSTTMLRYDHRIALAALRARTLWQTGEQDAALRLASACVDDALAVGHQLSLCYALAAGACPVASWSGELAMLERFVSLLTRIAGENSLEYWKQWAVCYECGYPSKGAVSHASGSDTFAPLAPPLHEMIATLDPERTTRIAIERAATMEAGASTPEILRAQGERLLAREGMSAAGRAAAFFGQAMERSIQQGAPSWTLRASVSLARLKLALGDPAASLRLVSVALDRLDARQSSRDVLEAVALRRQLVALAT
jgi:tetratricopeptide (TPR) repeat protein